MLFFGIFGLLLVGSIVAIIIGEKRYADGLEICGWVMGIFTLIALIICVCALPWKRDVRYDITKYEELKREVQQVSKMSGKECDLTILAKKDLFEDVRKMNNYIDKNKTYCDSWWVGWFYSREIGNLEKINYLYE
jgi:Na+/melibiose symporter-like transporter